MTRNELIGWAGIVIGLPGFALLFVNGHVAEGVLAVVIFGGLFWLRWVLSQPEFTVVDMQKVLTFHDPQAERATLSRHQKVRANHKGLREFWIRGILADGPIENILIDDKKPDRLENSVGAIDVCKCFDPPLERGQYDELTLSYDLIKAFENQTEGFIHVVGHKTKKLRMTVQFHHDKPCSSAEAFLLYGGQTHKNLGQPQVSDNGRRLEFETKRPKLGGEYYVRWRW